MSLIRPPSTELKMASAAVVTPQSVKAKSNGLGLVSWANELLKINFQDVQQFGSGKLAQVNSDLGRAHAPSQGGGSCLRRGVPLSDHGLGRSRVCRHVEGQV